MPGMRYLMNFVLRALAFPTLLVAIMYVGALAFSSPWWACSLTVALVALIGWLGLAVQIGRAYEAGAAAGYDHGAEYGKNAAGWTATLNDTAAAAARNAGYRVGRETGYIEGVRDSARIHLAANLNGVGHSDSDHPPVRAISESGSTL